MSNKILLFPLLFIITFISCRPATPVPKPRAYYRIELPVHAYQHFDSAAFPFRFEYPVYGKISQDLNLNKEEHAPYWLNIDFPDMDATIFLSYKPVTAEEPLSALIDQSYKLTYAHDIRADYIKSPQFKTKNGLTGVFYSVGGNAASAYQFFVTDNNKHFIRGALYFNTTPNADSLRPASEFLKKDIEYMVETIQFR